MTAPTQPTIQYRIELREGAGRAWLKVKCERHHQGECPTALHSGPARGVMWHWDGNVEHPTISPSIDCKGGCGRHFTITNGVVNG